MAFFASLLPCKKRLARAQFRQRLSAIPTILTKRGRREKIPRYRIGHYYPKRQQEQPHNLGRHFKEASHETSQLKIRFCVNPGQWNLTATHPLRFSQERWSMTSVGWSRTIAWSWSGVCSCGFAIT